MLALDLSSLSHGLPATAATAAGLTDMLALDLFSLSAEGPPSSPLLWRSVANIPARDPLSSEGISLLALADMDCLLAVGGYNGTLA